MPHPLTGDTVIAFVPSHAATLVDLYARPWLTATVCSGPEWAAAEGTAEIIGKGRLLLDADSDRSQVVLREIFMTMGGDHNGQGAVLLHPLRVYGTSVCTFAREDLTLGDRAVADALAIVGEKWTLQVCERRHTAE